MKSVLQACWLLTMAFGNLIIVLIADANIFSERSYEFFFFGGLMVVDIAMFAIMAYFYVPSNINKQEEEKDENNFTEKTINGTINGKDQSEKMSTY